MNLESGLNLESNYIMGGLVDEREVNYYVGASHKLIAECFDSWHQHNSQPNT